MSAAALRATHGATVADTPERGIPRRWRWVLSGGRPARGPVPSVPTAGAPTTTDKALGEAQYTVIEQPLQPTWPGAPSLYFTGHQDGRVRVWDTTAEVPLLLATVPFDAGGAGGKLRPVSAMQVPSLSKLAHTFISRCAVSLVLGSRLCSSAREGLYKLESSRNAFGRCALLRAGWL